MKFEFVFFRIRRCGFYRQLERQPVFGDVADCFNDLGSWTKGKPLRETNTFEQGTDNDGFPAYCYDFQKNASTGDVLLTLWNEVHNHRGQLPTVDGAAKVGAVQASSVGLARGAIPGYPSYFWIVPGSDLYAAVIPETSFGTGNGNFRKYVEFFLQIFSRHAKTTTTADGEVEVLGYSLNGMDLLTDVAPRLEISFCQRPGDIDFLRKNSTRIRKIIRRETIDLSERDRGSIVQTLLRAVPGFGQATPVDSSYRVKFEVSCRVTKEEFNSIASSVSSVAHLRSGSDVGFKLAQDSQIYWLGRSMVKAQRDWKTLTTDDGGVVDTSALFAKIQSDRAVLLGVVPARTVGGNGHIKRRALEPAVQEDDQ
jgi:hypothetical protein